MSAKEFALAFFITKPPMECMTKIVGQSVRPAVTISRIKFFAKSRIVTVVVLVVR